MRWFQWGRRRWQLVLVGTESGIRFEAEFLRFRSKRKAEAWADHMNSEDTMGLARWEVEGGK